jgi:tetratricopeptide (TPR) repeat protein
MKFFNRTKESTTPPVNFDWKRLNYEITFEVLPHKSLKRLPRQVREEMVALSELAQLAPEQVITPLLKLTKKFPHVPVFYNYLSVAYEKAGLLEKSYASIVECYKKHPDYLFAKTNYAFVCLNNQELDKIPEIFDHKFDLKLLYPEREIFHISEFTSFISVMASYHHAIGNRRVAKKYYQMLKGINPNHSMTKKLQKALYPSFFQQLFGRWGKKSQNNVAVIGKVEPAKPLEDAKQETNSQQSGSLPKS